MSHLTQQQIADKTYAGLIDCVNLLAKIIEHKIHQDKTPAFRRELVENILNHMKITIEKPILANRDRTEIMAAIAQARQYLAS